MLTVSKRTIIGGAIGNALESVGWAEKPSKSYCITQKSQ